MKILEKQDIRKFLAGFAGRDQLLSDLLNETLYGPLQRDMLALKEIVALDPDKPLHLTKKFNQRSQPWYRFDPTPELRSKVIVVTSWLMGEIGHIGYENISGPVDVALRGKLRAFKELDDVLRFAQKGTHFFSERDLEKLVAERIIMRDEKIGNIEHVASFPGRHNLFRIVTPAGMENAAKLAGNCLGNPKQPSPDFPHRKRVLHPGEWQYYSLRDPDGKSVITFMVDFSKPSIEYEGNKMLNVPKHAEKYIGMFCEHIYKNYPAIAPRTESLGYYGTLSL